MDVINWRNYLVFSKHSFLSDGHLDASSLLTEMPKAIGKESYHGIFDLEPRQTFKTYSGMHRPALGMYHLDFDDNATGGEAAKKDVLDFIDFFGLKENQFVLFFSGSKGFHLYLPEEFLGFKHDDKLPNKIKKLLENLSKKFLTLDKAIYNSARKFRTPFSKNLKTGLSKILLSHTELLLPLDDIKKKAATLPEFIDFTQDLDRKVEPNEKLLEFVITSKEKNEESKGKLSRHDKLVRFVLQEETASSLSELVQLTLEHDRIVNAKEAKGLYFEDKKYLKGKNESEACAEFVKKIIEYKKAKLKEKDIEWEVGADSNLVFERNEFGDPIPNVDNVVRFLSANKKYKKSIWWDDFKKRLFYQTEGKIKEWSDNDDLDLMVTFQRHWDMPYMSDTTVHKAIRKYAMKHVRNSAIEWLESLEWDGTNRITDFFIKYMGAEPSDYCRSASKNFFISMVARAYKPGCKVDNMIILEGEQGVKKSTACSALVGDDFFGEINESIDSKDFLLSLQGKLLIEIAELDSFSKAEMTRVKQVITCRVDRYRSPYGRSTEDHPRSCVFIGTTNEDAYLNDPTGARRFWPIKVGIIDVDAIKSDKDQLFAEAVKMFKEDSNWWEMPQQEAKDQQEARRISDDWEDAISNYLIGKLEVTTLDVATNALAFTTDKINQQVQRRVAKSLKANGLKCYVIKDGTKSRRVWKKDFSVDKVQKVIKNHALSVTVETDVEEKH